MKGETMIVPSMSAKHFKFIAETLVNRQRSHEFGSASWAATDVLIHDFAKALAATNSQFNREKFLKACGVE